MAEDDQAEPRRHGRFWRRVIAGLVVLVALLLLVHRPILLAIGRRMVLNYAAKHNLKADFRVEGNPSAASRFGISTRLQLVRPTMNRSTPIICTSITVYSDLRGMVFPDCSTTLKRVRRPLFSILPRRR